MARVQDLARFVAPALLSSALAACGVLKKQKDESDQPNEPGWACRLDSASDRCACSKLKPGWEASFASPDLQCQAYACCLLSENETESALASCQCYDEGPECQAEAGSRRATRVVSQCPPSDEVPASSKACAQPAENCRSDYLTQNELSGCCEGSICEANSAGVRVCREASAEETMLARKCEKVARTSMLDALKVSDGSLQTNVGTLQFDASRFPSVEVGAGGCLRGLHFEFTAQGGTCSFRLDVQDRGGRLAVTRISGLLNTCPGFTGSPLAGALSLLGGDAQAAIDFRFDGVSCDNTVTSESYCVSGRFDFHFHDSAAGISFSEDHLVLDGTVCGGIAAGACPQP